MARIYSISDLLPPDIFLIRTHPFRSPHHPISHAGLVGGGNWPHPGEVSLAHRGVLFLDELPEFGRNVLDEACQNLMRAAMTQTHLSAHAYPLILKPACTIANLANSPDIQTAHLAEALQYRPQVMY